jgi:7-carboxy-7-deazaguanine synthase
MPDTILISELFGPVLQGEGALAGKVSHFVRTSGCSYRCSWCDSMHAVDPELIKKTSRHLTWQQILEEVIKLPKAPWVTMSGGDPVAWDLGNLCGSLNLAGYKIAAETQGALWHDWLDFCELVTCSPKTPSSGMSSKIDIAMLRKYQARFGNRLVFKMVAFDETDLDFIERIHRAFPNVSLYITSGTMQKGKARMVVQLQTIEGFREISEAVLTRPALYDATVGCQNHVILYGRELAR